MASQVEYNNGLFTSECCHAFNIYDGSTCRCSKCGRVICRLKNDETLTIGVKFSNASTSNVSGDIVSEFESKAPRYAKDPTCELCNVKCPKCKVHCRYMRNPQGLFIYVCPNCRNVYKNDDFD